MFGLFRKKTQVEQLISRDGIDKACDRFAELISSKLSNDRVAYQFTLQELDGASQGNAESKLYAKNSGIPSTEYRGALTRSMPEIDGPDGPQQLLMALCLEFSDQRQMAEFRCKVGERIMHRFKLGRYSPSITSAKTQDDSDPFGFLDLDEEPEPQQESNYTIQPNGFTIKDAQSGDGMVAVIRDGMFQGAVLVSSIGATASLAPWPLDQNPFDDDSLFRGSGMSPKGEWSFSIRPSAPFSQILREARLKYTG